MKKQFSLARVLLNNPGLLALTVPEEQQELAAVATSVSTINGKASISSFKGRTLLKRTFNQSFPGIRPLRFWRVIGPASHPNLNSDLSIQGLKEWGIIPSGIVATLQNNEGHVASSRGSR